MSAPAICSCILLVIAIVFHLASCFMKDQKYADNSKPVLMPLLALTAVLSLIPSKAPTILVWYVTLALTFGTVGDVLLIHPKNKKRFLGGLGAFFIGHIFYLCIFAPAISKLPVWSYFIAAICTAGVVFVSWLTINKPKGKTGISICFYVVMLCALIFSGIANVIDYYPARPYWAHGEGSPLTILFGAILFMISDSVLSLSLFKKDFYPSRFIIMLTYIAAQVLLVYGACCKYL